MPSPPDISVVLPFVDDEDTIATALGRLVKHLRNLGVRFEVLAVDEASSDNSDALVGLVAQDIPEVRRIAADRGKGYQVGAKQALGKTLWLLSPGAALLPLGAFHALYNQVGRRAQDALAFGQRFVVIDRMRALKLGRRLRGDVKTVAKRISRGARPLGVLASKLKLALDRHRTA